MESNTMPLDRDYQNKISQMSLEQLVEAEKLVSEDFNYLSKEFITTRKERVEKMIKDIDFSIKCITSNQNSWHSYITKEVGRSNEFLNFTENALLNDVTEFKMGGVKNSFDVPLLREVPVLPKINEQTFFVDSFRKFINPYKKTLESMEKYHIYQRRLVQNTANRNNRLSWAQYYKDKKDHKERLIYELNRQLHELDKDFLDLNVNVLKKSNMEHYYRSLNNPAPIANKKKICKMNKTEVAEIRKRISMANRFKPDVTGFGGCSALNEDEIENDLFLLRSYKRAANREESVPEIRGNDDCSVVETNMEEDDEEMDLSSKEQGHLIKLEEQDDIQVDADNDEVVAENAEDDAENDEDDISEPETDSDLESNYKELLSLNNVYKDLPEIPNFLKNK